MMWLKCYRNHKDVLKIKSMHRYVRQHNSVQVRVKTLLSNGKLRNLKWNSYTSVSPYAGIPTIVENFF